MAKQEVLYVCEICGLKYRKEEEAVKCEKQHYKPIEITKVVYDTCESKKEYPITVNIKFKNERGLTTTITYSRKK